MLSPKTSQNQFPSAAFSSRRSTACLQTSEQIVQQFSCADRFTFRFPHPFPRGTEFTENPMTKCVHVCVSHSVSKSFYTQGAGARWGSPANEDTPHLGANVPAINCCPSCSTLFFAFMVVFMIRPPNQVSMHGVNSVC